jgi:hypothetical protein
MGDDKVIHKDTRDVAEDWAGNSALREDEAAFVGLPGCTDDRVSVGPPCAAPEFQELVIREMVRLSQPPEPALESIRIIWPPWGPDCDEPMPLYDAAADAFLVVVCVRRDYSTRVYLIAPDEFGHLLDLMKTAKANLEYRGMVAGKTPLADYARAVASEILGLVEAETCHEA